MHYNQPAFCRTTAGIKSLGSPTDSKLELKTVLKSLLQSNARMTTKLCWALLEAGWDWPQIEAESGLAARTIRRAKREIELGPAAQVGQTAAQVGQNGPGGPLDRRAPVSSIDKISRSDISQALPFESEVEEQTPPKNPVARQQHYWELVCGEFDSNGKFVPMPFDIATTTRLSTHHGADAVADALEAAYRQNKTLTSPGGWIDVYCRRERKTKRQPQPKLSRSKNNLTDAVARLAARGVE